jgi:hypothetical protein
VEHAREQYEVSERHACRLLGQWRRTQRYTAIQRIDEEALTEAIVALASEYGRYGYRRITALLQRAGWHVGKDRVQRIWRREGLKVPQKQRPRGRLWLNDGSCVRLRPERANHVWSGEQLGPLFVQHHFQALLRYVTRTGTVEIVADLLVVSGNSFGHRAGGASYDEEPAGDFLSGADFGEGTECGGIKINGERFVVSVEFFSGRHSQVPLSWPRAPRFAGSSRKLRTS